MMHCHWTSCSIENKFIINYRQIVQIYDVDILCVTYRQTFKLLVYLESFTRGSMGIDLHSARCVKFGLCTLLINNIPSLETLTFDYGI